MRPDHFRQATNYDVAHPNNRCGICVHCTFIYSHQLTGLDDYFRCEKHVFHEPSSNSPFCVCDDFIKREVKLRGEKK